MLTLELLEVNSKRKVNSELPQWTGEVQYNASHLKELMKQVKEMSSLYLKIVS